MTTTAATATTATDVNRLASHCMAAVRGLLYLDMIEEYARHTGHADLLREAVDGRVGEGAPADFAF